MGYKCNQKEKYLSLCERKEETVWMVGKAYFQEYKEKFRSQIHQSKYNKQSIYKLKWTLLDQN